MEQHLAVAMDTRRSAAVRRAAYDLYEIEAWYAAHTQRDFPFHAIPEDRREFVAGLIAERIQPPMAQTDSRAA